MKVSVYMALSANGLISNQRGVPDWLSQEYGQGFMAICQKTKAVIMGKATYKILAPNNLPLSQAGTTVVLTTNTDAKSENPTVVFTSKAPREIVSMLEERGHTEAVIIGGAKTVSDFMSARVVNDMYFVVEPVLFGGGLPLFKNAEFERKLDFVEMKKLNTNTIQLHYSIHA